jgi:uncharacterized protein (TIGR02391 family)
MDFGLPRDEERVLRLVLDGPRDRTGATRKLDIDRLIGDDAEPLLRNLVREGWLRPLMGGYIPTLKAILTQQPETSRPLDALIELAASAFRRGRDTISVEELFKALMARGYYLLEGDDLVSYHVKCALFGLEPFLTVINAARGFLPSTLKVSPRVQRMSTLKDVLEAQRDRTREVPPPAGGNQRDPTNRPRVALAALELHPRIRRAAEELYSNGHYRNAVLDAALALTIIVKEKARCPDLDGAALMRTVFSRNAPVLAFNDLADQSDLDEQEGLMHLFEGAMLAFRNPRAHDLAPDTAEYALECIGFLSMLAKMVDSAKRRTPETST